MLKHKCRIKITEVKHLNGHTIYFYECRKRLCSVQGFMTKQALWP